MKTVDFIQESDFPFLLPLIKMFAEKTDTPFYQHVNEVSASLMYDNILTIVGRDDENEEKIVAYLCGFYLNKTEFMVSQVFSLDTQVVVIINHFLDDHLRKCGVIKIIGHCKSIPHVIERYGYKIDRYIMVKLLTEREEEREVT